MCCWTAWRPGSRSPSATGGGRGNAAHDAGRLSLWLDELNIDHLVAVSGPAGGRHVFFNDGGAGSVIDLTIADGAVTTRNRLEVSNGITYTGTLNKLDVADEFTATIRCADFKLGYSGRRGATPGRALVDEGQTLALNFGGDWPEGTNVGTRLSVGGRLRLDSGRRQ